MNLNNLPEIKFAEKDPEEIINRMISDYEDAYYQSTGERKKLYPGDPIRIFLMSQALREVQLRQLIDDTAKQNLLAYSRDNNLDHLGAFSNTERGQAKAATVKQKFVLSKAQDVDKTLPEGTRVSPDLKVYFATTENYNIKSGTEEFELTVECLTKGEEGNDFAPGQINIIVDPQPWLESTENVETSQGGTDEEDNESYREKIRLAPDGYATAGPEKAYEYYARQYSSDIESLKVRTPSPGVVEYIVLLNDGELPTQAFLDGLVKFVSSEEIRPLTDDVQASAPTEVSYDLDLTYYISKENEGAEQEIKDKVEAAIKEYESWQRSKIGRDINPDELRYRIRDAGAKRVEMNNPIYAVIGDTEKATLNTKSVTYGGLEDE